MRTGAVLLFITATAFVGCTSGGDGGRLESDGSGGRSISSDGNPGPGLDAPAVHNRVRDARVILYQPSTGSAFVIVNANHSDRQTPEGRRALALGRTDVGYKVLSDLQIDALLESMKKYGAGAIEEPWRDADERYLRASGGQIPGFKGIVVVENDGEQRKYLGLSPQGDAAKAERYKLFVDQKTLVAEWYRSVAHVELPLAGAAGLSDPTRFDVPRSTNNPR